MCPLTARLLAFLYTNQTLRVRWNGSSSAPFFTSNGVKQGGILSPILFCVYIDELLCRLKRSKVGCYMGNRFYGAIGYADDLCLLAPSRSAACVLLNICEEYGKEYNVKFNSTKSHLILYNFSDHTVQPLIMNSQPLIIHSNATHLGRPVGNPDCNDLAVTKGINELTWRTNYVMRKFGFCAADIRLTMFRTYCTNYYGCPLWKLDSKSIHRFCARWRKCVRKLWNVPPMTHCRYVEHLYDGPCIEAQLLCRFLSFYQSIITSNNPCVYMCGRLLRSSNTAAATNLKLLSAK